MTVLPVGMFGTGTARIDSTFDVHLMQAGNDIDVNGVLGGRLIHLVGFTDITGLGNIDVRVNGTTRAAEAALRERFGVGAWAGRG